LKLASLLKKSFRINNKAYQKNRYSKGINHSMNKIAVLVPCFNESVTIAKVVRDFRKAIPSADVYVFDNNSTDGTAEIARQEGAIVIPEYQQGKGFVVRSMFRTIEADCYLMIDGDDTYSAEDAKKLIEPVLDKKVDMVIGDRLSGSYFTENKRPFHNSGNRAVRFLINTLFNSRIRDIMTGYRAFSRRFVKTFPVLSNGFEIETEMTIHALDKRFLVTEVSVGYRDRPEGSVSKLDTFSDGIRVLKTIVTLFKDYKPFLFFGTISAVFFVGGTFLFVPVLLDFLATGLVPKMPTLLIAVCLWILSMLSLVSGVILVTVKKYVSQIFELEITRAEQSR
jgi:glycosyltransferase involved in cell wall biosynthesis